MTVNLYVGGNTSPVLSLDPTDPQYFTNLVMAVTTVYQEIIASNPTVRLKNIAHDISSKHVDVVAVEEASLIRRQSPGDLALGGTTPATTVVADYLQILLDDLKAEGEQYAVASSIEEFDVELPMLNLDTGGLDDARLTDRDAILVRVGPHHHKIRIENVQSGHFTHLIELPALGLSVLRGWCSAELVTDNRRVKFICTHLEEETSPELQIAQAQELIDGPAHTNLPLILAGDFNSDSLHRDGTHAYDTIAAAGFVDTWLAVHPHRPAGGLTWGHDELLADRTTLFDRRIDRILVRTRELVPIDSKVLDFDLHRTTPPLWASDHAGVLTEIHLCGDRN